MAKHCLNRAQCSFYASIGHRSQEYTIKDKREAYRCTLYKSPNVNHLAQARECLTKVQKQVEARQAYSKRPTHFQERKEVQGSKRDEVMVTPTPSRDPSPTRGTTTQTAIPCTQFVFTAQSQVQSTLVQSTQIQSDSEDEDFIEVLAPKRKRGRPPTSIAPSKAAKNIQDIQSTFQSIGLVEPNQGSPIGGRVNYSSQGLGATQGALARLEKDIIQELSISQEVSFVGLGEGEASSIEQQGSILEATS